MSTAGDTLEKAFQKQLDGIKDEKQVIFSKKPPPPILPTTPQPWKFEDINLDEIARQLTLIEYDLFKAIKPWECLNQAWTKKVCCIPFGNVTSSRSNNNITDNSS